jgi:hypothetical protein
VSTHTASGVEPDTDGVECSEDQAPVSAIAVGPIELMPDDVDGERP